MHSELERLFSLDGRTALVTGAARGIGLAMARALAQVGAHVVLNDVRPDGLEQAANVLHAEGLSVSTSAFDVTDEQAVTEAVAAIGRAYGLDILVNNAAVQQRKPVLEYSAAEWRRIIDTDLTGCFLVAQAAARIMQPCGYGRIINIASIVGRQGKSQLAPYSAAKGGLDSLTRVLAVEFGGHGITANAIAPGYFETDFNTALLENTEFVAWVNGRTPAGRWGKPKDLLGAVLYLASDAGAYMNGNTLTIDGGLTVAL